MRVGKSAVVLMMSLLLILSACGSKGDNQNNAGTDDGSKAKDKVVVKLYTNGKGDDSEPLIKVMNAFNEQSDTIKIEHVSLVQNFDSREMLQKLDILSASGEQVDIILLNNEGFVTERAGNGMLEPLTSYLEEAGITPEDEWFRNPKYNDDYYGLMTDAAFWFVALNKDHLEEANLEVPSFDWTWDDFKEYAVKLTQGEGVEKRYGAYFHTWGEYANLIAYTDFRNPQMKEDFTLQFDDPTFEYWFDLRRTMEREDKSTRPLADILASKQHWATDFMTEKASMMPIATFAIDEAFLDMDNYPRDFQIALAPLPRSSSEVEGGLTNIGGSFLTISKRSNFKQEAFEFIKWATMEGSNHAERISGWRHADSESIMTDMIGDKLDLVDFDSLIHTLFDPRVRAPESSAVSISYQQQLKKVAEAGMNKFLLDNISFEEARDYMLSEGQKVIDQYQ